MDVLDRFFEDDFFRLLGKRKIGGKGRDGPPSQKLAKLGFAVAPTLARLLDFVATHDTNEIGPLGVFPIDDILATGKNALAFMLEQPFRVDAGLLHAWPLGTTGAGDVWLVSLTPQKGRHEVFLFGHDTGTVELVADSLPAFALALHLSDRDTEATPAERRALAGHAIKNDDIELAWLRAKLPKKAASPLPSLLERTHDLRSTLNDYGRHEPAASTVELPPMPLPAEALDAMLRAFLRGEDAKLRALFQRFARSPAGLVRDTVSYLQKLLAQRGAATFERRVALLLDPAKKAAEASYKKRMAAREIKERKQRKVAAAAFVASSKATDLQNGGEHRRAVDAFRKAVTLAPRDGKAWAAMCYSLYCLKRWADMRDAAEQAVRFDGESSYAYQQLAVAYAGLKDDARTIEASRRAVTLDSKNAYAMYILATHLLVNKKIEGRELLEKACKLNPAFRATAAGDDDVQKALASLA